MGSEEKSKRVNEKTRRKKEWTRFLIKVACDSALFPCQYSRFLIQLGHEPIAPRPTTTLFGKPAVALPNILEYVAYIKSVDGLAGCYRGLPPRLVGNIVAPLLTKYIVDRMGIENIDENKRVDKMTEDEYRKRFIVELRRNIVYKVVYEMIFSMFRVISMRMMAQFIGRESKYKSVLGSILQIYKDEGFLGFFVGLGPRLTFDLTCIIVASTATYYRGKNGPGYFKSLISIICSSIFYPLNVVSSIMSVNTSGLDAGSLPFMPIYENSLDCYKSLRLAGDHKRGLNLAIRHVKPKSF